MERPDILRDPQVTVAPPTSEEQIREVLRLFGDGQEEQGLLLFAALHPGDQAEVLHAMPLEAAQEMAAKLPPEWWGEMLEHLYANEAGRILSRLEPEPMAAILNRARPEIAADVLHTLPAETATAVLAQTSRAGEIAPLMTYRDETAGGLMAPVSITVSDHTTVSQFMSLLRQLGPLPRGRSTYFVVDRQGKLLGMLDLADLVFAQPRATVHAVMQEPVVTVRPDTDQEECARLMDRYGLSELPVVDYDGRLLGTILVQEAYEIAEEEATEDMFRLAAMGPRESLASSVGRSVLHRLPWLLVNLGTVILAAAVISLFESTIARLVVLATFISVVASQGGAAATQTLTLMVRSIALGEVSFRSVKRILFREVAVGLINGAILGVLIGGVGLLWEGSIVLGVALLIGMLANMVFAALAGALIPLGLRAAGLDPALASVVIVTTITDVAGFAVYLGTATVMLWVVG